MEYKELQKSELVQLARLALAGRPQDIQLYLRRMARRYQTSMPDLAKELRILLQKSPTRSSPLRQADAPAIPLDSDSRLELIRCDLQPQVDVEPIFDEETKGKLDQLIAERNNVDRLLESGLTPTRTVLLTGPPGVGKSLSARWLAQNLKQPLLTLDLSAVMSSYLGRTGNNVRYVLDYAKNIECVLLIDELDAIAKRRDDDTEIGELKRLVTVLLQEIDDWPSNSILIAATNHPDLLDPAVWRRFEMKIDYPMPNKEQVRQAVEQHLRNLNSKDDSDWIATLAALFNQSSYSDIESGIMRMRRAIILTEIPIENHIPQMIKFYLNKLKPKQKIQITVDLVKSKILSQHKAHELTGVSRDTIRKYLTDTNELRT